MAGSGAASGTPGAGEWRGDARAVALDRWELLAPAIGAEAGKGLGGGAARGCVCLARERRARGGGIGAGRGGDVRALGAEAGKGGG